MSWSARVGLAILSVAAFVTGGSAKTASPFGARATDAGRDVPRPPDHRAWQFADDDSNSSGGNSSGPHGTIGVRG